MSQNNEVMEFVVYCIEPYKLHRGLTGEETFKLFEKYGVFKFLEDGYDVLHTTGDDYINRQIDAFLRKRVKRKVKFGKKKRTLHIKGIT